METKRKTKYFQRICVIIGIVCLLVSALSIPTFAINEYMGNTNFLSNGGYRTDNNRIFTPFTLYLQEDFEAITPDGSTWANYGIDYTHATPSVYVERGTIDDVGMYDQMFNNAVRENTNENDYYVTTIHQGISPLGDIGVTDIEGGYIATKQYINAVLVSDGYAPLGGANDTGYYGAFTKKATAVASPFLLTYEMIENDLIAEIILAESYTQSGVASYTDLDVADTHYKIEFITSGGRHYVFEDYIRFNANIVGGDLATALVNQSNGSIFSGYQQNTVGINTDYFACSVPLVPSEFYDYLDTIGQIQTNGFEVYITDLVVEIEGYEKEDYEMGDYFRRKPLVPIVKTYTNYYDYDSNTWYNRIPQDTNAFLSNIGFASYEEGYRIGNDVGYSEGYQDGVQENFEDWNFASFLGTAVGGFLDTPLFGFISIGGMLAVVIGLSLLILFLKFFAGG